MAYLITNQNNFGSIPYPCPSFPRATVKTGGCGPCAVLNCVENMTSLRFFMRDWIKFVMKNNGRIDGGTSIPKVLKALEDDYGFSYRTTNDNVLVGQHLKNGGKAIFHVGGAYGSWKGLLSSEGHYVCLGGVDARGRFIVLDSGWYQGKYDGTWRKARCTKGNQDGIVLVSKENLEKDKKYRRNEGVNYYLLYAPEEPKEDDMVYYKTMKDIPDYGKKTVEKLISKGYLKGTASNTLDISEDMLRILVIHDRSGIYD